MVCAAGFAAALWLQLRTVGASFADWIGKPHHIGSGLGWGDGVVAGVATLLIVGLVAYVAATRSDIQRATIDQVPHQPTGPRDTESRSVDRVG